VHHFLGPGEWVRRLRTADFDQHKHFPQTTNLFRKAGECFAEMAKCLRYFGETFASEENPAENIKSMQAKVYGIITFLVIVGTRFAACFSH
jgi:hypothetical protein